MFYTRCYVALIIMENMLEICIDEFAHSTNREYMEQNISFAQLREITKFFFKWNGITSDFLWETYNSENRELITTIPLVKEFLKDCANDYEVETLIRGLV